MTLTEKLYLNIGSYANPDPNEYLFAQIWQVLGGPTLGAVVSNVVELLEITHGDGGADIKWDAIGEFCSGKKGPVVVEINSGAVVGCSANTTAASGTIDIVHAGALALVTQHFD